MQRDRGARLRAAMRDQGLDALLLLVNSNVSYATGATWPFGDAGQANVERPVAVVLAEDDVPHLFTPFRDAIPVGLDDEHVHRSAHLDVDEGVDLFAKELAGLLPSGATLAVDDLTGAMNRQRSALLPDWPPRAASEALGPARIIKTPDELACMRHALWISELAMGDVQAHLAPGQRQTELTARFLRNAFELGAEANILDPIWQVMPPHRADLPWTVHGDIACPLLTTERELQRGDVLWVDTALMYGGYHSDFGRTWVVGQDPTPRQHAQYARWREINDAVLAVVRAGANGAELTRAATDVCDGERPWLPHFYISHGLGLDSAEMPFFGSDLGDDFDAGFVLQAGMILVVEPVVWDEGHSGYRSENVFVVTDDGCTSLTDYPYAPYGD